MTPAPPRSPANGASVSTWIQRQWQQDGWFCALMRPLAALTARHVRNRRAQYAAGKKSVYRAPVPVIVIGNIYVGGTGKTPVVIATVQALRARGWTPGVISRGYGVKIGAEARVGIGDMDPAAFGDEPALIAHTTQAPVACHPRRALAVQALLKAHPQTDVIVSDDGLQHLALARDLEIIVQDARGVGNGRLLPAGPLREPATRLMSVDYVITNQAAGELPQEPSRPPPTVAGSFAASTPHPGTPAPVDTPVGAGMTRHVAMWLRPGLARHLVTGRERALADFAGPGHAGRVAAAAGIGNPERFFTTLRAAGIHPEPCLALPDHYDYRQSPFDALPGDVIFVTAKDAIKCRRLPDPRLWEVPVQAQFSDSDLFVRIDATLRAQVQTH